MKLLVIRFSSIGDIVLASPVIRCVKQQIPGAEVHFLTKRSFKAVTEANPYIDKFHYFDGNLDQLISTLKDEQFDQIIDLHKNYRTWRIKNALKVPALTYRKLSWQKFLLTCFGINRMPGRHITDRSLDTVVPLGVKDDGKGLDYFIPEGVHLKVNDLPLSHSAGYVAIVIGASYFSKKMPVHKMRELCTKLNYPIVLVGGKDDQQEGEEIATLDPIRIYNACGKFSLHESALIVKQAQLVISHDTGLQYIACAFNKPVLAIWGGTSPKLDVEPYYGALQLQDHQLPPYQNFIVPGLPCQPCSNYGSKTCKRAHFNCMLAQDTTKMAVTAERYVNLKI